jgi:hypothetical protein
MSPGQVRPDNPIPVPRERPMVTEIEELLNAPTSGVHAPSLARMEETLTEGYARALALEAERSRLERRLGEVAREGAGEDPSDFAEQVRTLASRATHADGELRRLRSLLGSLRERTSTVRAAS